MKKIGIYIHIPFCKQKCYYCDFISFAKNKEVQERYIEALKNEIKNCKIEAKDISTIYIGGGTPSFIEGKYIKEILSLIKEKWKYKVKENHFIENDDIKKSKIQNNTEEIECEITIEVNPGTVNEQKIIEYKEAGINRLSIGLQSTHNRLLEEIGRIHTYEQFLETYNMARKIGFENINVDLMLGLPNQTIQDLKESLDNVIKLNPEHISVYSLIVEDGTKICKMIEEGTLKLPNEDLERNMYWYTKNTLELNGYNHYEISNFSKEGKESKHNMDCWNQNEYIGFGLAAHSYVNKKRFSNTTNLEEYIKNCNSKNFEKNIQIEEIQNGEMEQKEFMMLALRKIKGASIKKFKNKFGENPLYIFRNELSKLTQENLIEVDGDYIKLTKRGLDLANLVWEEFI